MDSILAELDRCQSCKGNDQNVIKSKGESALVAKCITCHMNIYLRQFKQTENLYDQINLMQFIQGFVQRVLDEKNRNARRKCSCTELTLWRTLMILRGKVQKHHMR